jgi:hypothetical protein
LNVQPLSNFENYVQISSQKNSALKNALNLEVSAEEFVSLYDDITITWDITGSEFTGVNKVYIFFTRMGTLEKADWKSLESGIVDNLCHITSVAQ